MRTTAHLVHHNRSLQNRSHRWLPKRGVVIWSSIPMRSSGSYQSRLPEDVCDRARLEKFDREVEIPAWTKRLRDAADLSVWLQSPPIADEEPTCYMRPEDLIETAAEAITKEAFPDELHVGRSRLPLDYHFEPGSEHDGIELKIHQAALSQVSDDLLGWLVPGLLETKLVAMIKALPKRIRRNLVPAADIAEKLVANCSRCMAKCHSYSAVCESMSRACRNAGNAR